MSSASVHNKASCSWSVLWSRQGENGRCCQRTKGWRRLCVLFPTCHIKSKISGSPGTDWGGKGKKECNIMCILKKIETLKTRWFETVQLQLMSKSWFAFFHGHQAISWSSLFESYKSHSNLWVETEKNQERKYKASPWNFLIVHMWPSVNLQWILVWSKMW